MKKAADIKNLQNAERDLNTLFQQEGLSLPIKPTFVTFGLQDVPYLSLATWYSYLLGSHPHLVLGGFSTNDWNASLLLDSFWKNFQCTAPDHAVFDLHGGGNRLSRCLPFMLHLDEGVGLRKSAVLVLSMQPLFGRETAERYVAYRHEKDIHLRMTMAMFHNCMGSTFLSRFLFTVMSKKMYSGKNTGTYCGMLDILAEECKELMTNGVTINNDTWYPVCLGIKGDQPALIKCGNFKRSFMNLGRNKGCCWECLAGYDNIPFEDIHDGAAWEGTIGLVDPWPATSPSPLLKIPSYSSNPTLFWKRDPFHAFKQTIGGHFAASLIIVCTVDCGLWKADGLSSSVDEMLGRAFYDFRFWVWHEWRGSVVNHIKSFTRQILHFKDQWKFSISTFQGQRPNDHHSLATTFDSTWPCSWKSCYPWRFESCELSTTSLAEWLLPSCFAWMWWRDPVFPQFAPSRCMAWRSCQRHAWWLLDVLHIVLSFGSVEPPTWPSSFSLRA